MGLRSSRLMFDWGLLDGFDAADILRCRYVNIPLYGLMVALFLMRSLVSPLRVLGSVLTFPGIGRVLVGGVISMVLVLQVVWLISVEVFALCLVLFRLFRDQSFGGSSCPAGVHGCSPGLVRRVARLLDGCRSSCLAELLNDGDLLVLIDRVLEQVKGHADEMVRVGQVRELDKLGHAAAD